jgi:hypothetical protein
MRVLSTQVAKELERAVSRRTFPDGSFVLQGLEIRDVWVVTELTFCAASHMAGGWRVLCRI